MTDRVREGRIWAEQLLTNNGLKIEALDRADPDYVAKRKQLLLERVRLKEATFVMRYTLSATEVARTAIRKEQSE